MTPIFGTSYSFTGRFLTFSLALTPLPVLILLYIADFTCGPTPAFFLGALARNFKGQGDVYSPRGAMGCRVRLMDCNLRDCTNSRRGTGY